MDENILTLNTQSILRVLSPVIVKILGQSRNVNSSLLKHVIESQKIVQSSKEYVNVKLSISNFQIISKLLREPRNLPGSAVEYLQNLSLIGLVSRKSCLYQIQDSSFFMLDLSFVKSNESGNLNATMGNCDHSSDTVQLIFMGALAPIYHRFLELGKAYLCKKLRMMTLFPKKPNERKILLFKEGKSTVALVRESSYIDFTECVPPSLTFSKSTPVFESSLLKDSLTSRENKENHKHVTDSEHRDDDRFIKGVISFTGKITKILDIFWKIIQLDDEYEAVLSHCDEHVWKLLMVGQEITLRHVHYISEPERDHRVTFGACGMTQIEIINYPLVENADNNSCNMKELAACRRIHGLLKSVPLKYLFSFRNLYYMLSNEFQLAMPKQRQLFEWCYSLLGKRHERDVYTEYLNHSSICDFSIENNLTSSFFTPKAIKDAFRSDTGYGAGLNVNVWSMEDLELGDYFVIGQINRDQGGCLSLKDQQDRISVVTIDDCFRVTDEGAFVALHNPKLVLETIRMDNQMSRERYLLTDKIEQFLLRNDSYLKRSTSKFEIDATSRVVFITQICGPIFENDFLETCVYGTSFLLKSLENEEFQFECGSDICIKFSSNEFNLTTGTWVLVNASFESIKSGDLMYTKYDKSRNELHKVVFRHRFSNCAINEMTIGLSRHCCIIADTLENTYLNRSRPMSVRQLLEVPYSFVESEKRLSGAYFDQLVSFEGVLIEKGLRVSDNKSRGTGWYQTPENFAAFTVGLGISGCILHFKVRDVNTADAIDVYYDNFKMRFPVGLLPGRSLVRFDHVALKRSQTGSLFAHIIPLSQIKVIDLVNDSFDEQTLVQELDVDECLKRVSEITLLATIDPRKSQQAVFYITANIVRFLKIIMKVTCEKCFSTISKNRCGKCHETRDHVTRCNFSIEVNAIICDGSRDALITCCDRGGIQLLNLKEKEIDELCSICARVGEVTIQDLNFEQEEPAESNGSKSKLEVDVIKSIIHKSIGKYETHQNLLIGCKSNLRNVKPEPNEIIQRLAKSFPQAGFDNTISIRSFRIGGIDVNTLVIGGLYLTGVEVFRLPANKLAALLLTVLR